MKKIFPLFLFISGCMVGPNYHTPEISVADTFVEATPSQNEISSLTSWWKIFEDPLLNELITIGAGNNYTLKIAQEKIEQTRAFYRLKRADLFPEVDASAEALRTGISQNYIVTSFLPTTNYNQFSVGFDALWEIDIFGKLRREKESAYYQIQAQQESLRNVYVTLISDIAKNHIDNVALNNQINLLKQKIELQQTILSLTENKTTSGLNSYIEPETQLAQLQQEEENLLAYRTLSKQTIYRLAALLGIEAEKIDLKFTTALFLPNANKKVEVGLPSTLLRRRPDIRVAERELAKATAQVGSAIADYFPRFSLTGSSFYESSTIKNLIKSNSFSWTLGSIMKWPIITFGRIRANVDVKKSEEKQALLFYENTIIEALQDVESSLAAYFNEQEKLQKAQRQLLAEEKITHLMHNKYTSGLIDYPTYLQQKMIYLDTKILEINIRRNLALNLIALYKALGGGDWEDPSQTNNSDPL